MIEETISTKDAQRYYDRIGARYDWAEIFESRAKQGGLSLLELSPGLRVLNIGVGTGKQHARLRAAVEPDGAVIGIDLSPVMLNLTRSRAGLPLCQADTHRLPFATASFDRLHAAFLLDLIPVRALPALLTEYRRVLKSDGRLVLVSLTEGVDRFSRMLIGLWKMIHRYNPRWCGGCRPIQLSELLYEAGFTQVERGVVVQLGVPSEVIVATGRVA